MAKIQKEALKEITSFEALLNIKYGEKGTQSREEFEAKAQAFQLCENLKEKRKTLGITQKKLSQMTGLDETFISRVEQGETDIQLSTLLKIIHGLGLTLSIS